MIDYKIFFGGLSVLLGILGYGIYFKQIFSGKIKPHTFSWFVWGITTAIIFFAQVSKNAGAGAWAIGVVSLACFSISIIALFKGEKGIVFWDWIFLAVALLGIFLWWLTQDPLLAVILVSITDAAATFPTIFKAYRKPYEESFALFFINSLRSLISIFAIESYSLTTVLHPAKLVVFNSIVVMVILYRRSKYQAKQSPKS